jgi:hypothetical protein
MPSGEKWDFNSSWNGTDMVGEGGNCSHVVHFEKKAQR